MGVLGRLEDAQRATIAARLPGVELVDPDAHAVRALVAWDLDVPRILGQLARQPSLEWLHLRWAGVPPDVLSALADHQAVLSNGSGAHGPAIAEYVLGVTLAHFRRLHELHQAQLCSEWLPGVRVRELRGSLIGILGLGDLGRSTARLLRACGVRLRGLRRSDQACPDVDELFGPGQLGGFLDGLDVLVIAAPLTPSTHGLIGAAELARLGPGALLVNVGRGALVDEAALVAALEQGELGGAALDVFVSEPLPADSPLWRLPGVFISPHCADATPRSLERGFEILLDNLARFAGGEPLRNVVDPAHGY